MNFLEIVQALHRESTDSGTGPSTVVGQSGELARFVAWCSDGYQALQIERDDWRWLRRNFTVNTVAGTDNYAFGSCTDSTSGSSIDRFSRWYEGRDETGFPYFSAYLTATGVGDQQPLLSIDWDLFRRLYKFSTQTNARPVHVAVGPDRKFYLGPKPDDTYTVGGTFQRGPQILALDADEPEMPLQYHALVWLEGLSRFGGNRVAPEAMLRAASEGGILRSSLELDQLPKMGYGAPLA